MKQSRGLYQSESRCIELYYLSLVTFSFQSDLPSKKAKLQASPVHANQEPDTPSCSEEVSNFKPFDYSSKTFSDIKKGNSAIH